MKEAFIIIETQAFGRKYETPDSYMFAVPNFFFFFKFFDNY